MVTEFSVLHTRKNFTIYNTGGKTFPAVRFGFPNKRRNVVCESELWFSWCPPPPPKNYVDSSLTVMAMGEFVFAYFRFCSQPFSRKTEGKNRIKNVLF